MIFFYCSGCKLAKFSSVPFEKSVSSSLTSFDIVHDDVWGLAHVSAKVGMKRRSNFLGI